MVSYEIQRLVREKEHIRRKITFENVRRDASLLSLANVAAKIAKHYSASDEVSGLGDEINPRAFTEFFSDISRANC